MNGPQIELRTADTGHVTVCLSGDWTLVCIGAQSRVLQRRLSQLCADRGIDALDWDLHAVRRLDSLGALVIWRAWMHREPAHLQADARQRAQFDLLSRLDMAPASVKPSFSSAELVMRLGHLVLGMIDHMRHGVMLFGQLVLDLLHVSRRPADAPLREISANLYKSGVRALPITALVGFLIGVVLSYLSALQLKNFGADIYIVNILGLGIVRELGPVLVAVLVAGRSGSAMTAQLGVMRVTEEIDALTTMGVSRSLRLVLPKVIALAMVMPLLVLWTSAMAIMGGMVSANFQLGIAYPFFIQTLAKVVPVANLYIALTKGLAFGMVVALVACHFGLRVRPNTESLSANTTASVVSAITCVILVDAVFAVATRRIGLPV